MSRCLDSVRYAARVLIRTPAFALTAVLTLTVVIGANTTLFSLIDSVLLRPLPYPESDRLVHISHSDRASSVPRDISPGFQQTWGFEPALGRGFVREEHAFGGPASVLVSDGYWRDYLDADPGAIGATLVLNGRPMTVVGVIPADPGPVEIDADLWFPLQVDAAFVTQRQTGWFSGIVRRMSPGVSIRQAELDLQAVQSQLAEEYPETNSGLAVTAVPFRDIVIGPFSSSLGLLLGAVSLLLLIACTNIAAFLLARSTHRQADSAIRFALGASRRRIAIHVFAETALLVAAGTVAD